MDSLKQVDNPAKNPLRCVILDNDETTGCYTLVFSLVNYLSKHVLEYHDQIEVIFTKLALFMEEHHLFRPGLRALLKELCALRRDGHIDKIFMYTNQRHQVPLEDQGTMHELLHSVPMAISFMMNVLADDEDVFDHHYTRPIEHWGQTGVIPKYFSRIFETDTHKEYVMDMQYMIFVDDMAHPNFIKADGFQDHQIKEHSWYRVEPYYATLEDHQLEHFMFLLFENKWVTEDSIKGILKQYIEYMPKRKSDMSAKTLDEVRVFIRNFFTGQTSIRV